MADNDQPQVDNLQEARDQADEHNSFVRSGRVKAHKTGEWFTIPSLLLLDDDQQAEYNKMIHRLNQCDHHPEVHIPEQQVPERVIKVTEPDGTVNETTVAAHTIPARTVPGDFIEPYQKDGALIEPPYNVQIAQILLGDDYERFKKGGGRSSDVRLELLRMKRESEERANADSKSVDSSAPVETVSTGD